MKRKELVTVFLILLLSAALRFWRLGEVPVGVHRDEVQLGYNAYSILKTGRDITGTVLPLHLPSFLYSPAGYSYVSIPFIVLFDLNAFSIRFASALFGTLTVVALYYLAREMFQKNKKFPGLAPRSGAGKFQIENFALIASSLLAISPWHINLSRTATENTIAIFLLLAGLLSFLRWVRVRHLLLLVVSFLLWGLSLFFYQAPRSFLPLFVPFLVFLYRREIQNKKYVILLFVVTIILPIILILGSPQLSLRLSSVSILATSESELTIAERIAEDGLAKVSPLISRIFHNKPLTYLDAFLKNYFAHFTYDFYFTDRALPDRYRVPGEGLLPLVFLPLILLGLLDLFRTNRRTLAILAGWILLVPVGSAAAFDDVPNLQRTLALLPPIIVMVSVGFFNLWQTRPIIRVGLALWLTISVASYLHGYYVHQVYHRPWYRHEGYEELTKKLITLSPSPSRIIVTNHESAPSLFIAYFSKLDPALFQQSYQTRGAHINRVPFGKFEFPEIDCPTKEYAGQVPPGTLLVDASTCPKPTEKKLVLQGEVKRNDGTVVFRYFSYQF